MNPSDLVTGLPSRSLSTTAGHMSLVTILETGVEVYAKA
jgi:hypothetical protein